MNLNVLKAGKKPLSEIVPEQAKAPELKAETKAEAKPAEVKKEEPKAEVKKFN